MGRKRQKVRLVSEEYRSANARAWRVQINGREVELVWFEDMGELLIDSDTELPWKDIDALIRFMAKRGYRAKWVSFVKDGRLVSERVDGDDDVPRTAGTSYGDEPEWSTDTEEPVLTHPCPLYRPTIEIPRNIFLVLKAIVEEAKPNEVLAYLDAEEKEPGHWVVKGVDVPRQEVSTTSVEVKEVERLYPGVLHSHPFTSSRTSFSHVDDTYINRNHSFSIVVNGDGEVSEALAKVKLPCGHTAITRAEVRITDEEEERAREMAKKLLDGKLERKTYTPYRGGGWYYGRYGYYGYGYD